MSRVSQTNRGKFNHHFQRYSIVLTAFRHCFRRPGFLDSAFLPPPFLTPLPGIVQRAPPRLSASFQAGPQFPLAAQSFARRSGKNFLKSLITKCLDFHNLIAEFFSQMCSFSLFFFLGIFSPFFSREDLSINYDTM